MTGTCTVWDGPNPQLYRNPKMTEPTNQPTARRIESARPDTVEDLEHMLRLLDMQRGITNASAWTPAAEEAYRAARAGFQAQIAILKARA